MAVASTVTALVVAGLALMGISAHALRTADSMRQFLDHLIHGDRVAPGAALLASGVSIILLAPMVALVAVAFFGKGPRLRHILLALGVLAVTTAGVVLAFL